MCSDIEISLLHCQQLVGVLCVSWLVVEWRWRKRSPVGGEIKNKRF